MVVVEFDKHKDMVVKQQEKGLAVYQDGNMVAFLEDWFFDDFTDESGHIDEDELYHCINEGIKEIMSNIKI